jgi:colanic acid biosynthesis glycosyl transferase WcaI
MISCSSSTTIAWGLDVIKIIKKTLFILNVQDIYPDVAVLMGVLKNKTVISLLRHLERFSYNKADCITVIAESFRNNLLSKGISNDKIKLLTNWIDTDEIIPLGKTNYFSCKVLEGKFIVLYAGC